MASHLAQAVDIAAESDDATAARWLPRYYTDPSAEPPQIADMRALGSCARKLFRHGVDVIIPRAMGQADRDGPQNEIVTAAAWERMNLRMKQRSQLPLYPDPPAMPLLGSSSARPVRAGASSSASNQSVTAHRDSCSAACLCSRAA